MPYSPYPSSKPFNIGAIISDIANFVIDVRAATVDYSESGVGLFDPLPSNVRIDIQKSIIDLVAVGIDALLIFERIKEDLPLAQYSPLPGIIISLSNFINDANDAAKTVQPGADRQVIGKLLIVLADGLSAAANGFNLFGQVEIGVPMAVSASVLNALGIYLSETDPNKKPEKHPHPSTPRNKSDPLVLDLAGAGISLTALSGSKAYFDYNGSGIPVQTGWVGTGQGLLVLAPADGATVTAADMLGAYSGNGFADLAALDSNGDGVINAGDAAYAQLRVWVDTSGTGQSNAGELFTLAQLGITSISVNAQTSGADSNGNTIVATSSFAITNPATGATSTNTIAEVNFAANLQITQLPSSTVTPSQTALNLPNLTGFGFLPDLNVAMTADPALEKMVYNLVFNAGTMTSDQFNAAFQAMVYQWADATAISSTAYGNFVNGQHQAVIYAYLGINPATNPQYAGWQPNAHSGPTVWEPEYQQFLQFAELAFMSQIAQSQVKFGIDPATAYAGPYASLALLAYDASSNTLLGDPANLAPILLAQAPGDPAAAASYWALVQNAIGMLNYTQGDAGVYGDILAGLAKADTLTQTLATINILNQNDPVFAISSVGGVTQISGDGTTASFGTGFVNIASHGTSVTYAGTGSVEIAAGFCSDVV